MQAGRRDMLATGAGLLAAALVTTWILLPEGTRPAHTEMLHAAVLAAATLVASAVAVSRVRRPPTAEQDSAASRGDGFLAGGLVAYALGWSFWAVFLWRLEDPPYPSGADVLWLLLYPGAVVTLYREAAALSRSRRAFLLDIALGTAGVAAAVVGFALRVFLGTVDDNQLIAVNVIYLGADVAMFLLAFQVLALSRFRGPWPAWARAAGFLVLAVSDSAYMQIVVATGRVPTDGPVAAGWFVAVLLLVASIGPKRRNEPRLPPRWSAFVVPTAGTLLALAVLVDAPLGAWAARLLAAAAIVLAAVRLGVAVNDTTSLSASHEMAVTDELTGLRNRRGFFDESVRRRPGPAALVLLDLDRFKEVNDTFGHGAGDALLSVVARRLAEASREHLGSEPDVVARLGGDEFAVRLAAATEAQALEAAGRMVDAVCSRYDVDGVRLRVAVSAGVAFDGSGSVALTELLRRADLAMYAAKGTGGRVVAFGPELDSAGPEVFARRDATREALGHGAIELHFQPEVELTTGRVVGVEALARLRTGDGELLLPADFLPDLADGGLLGELTTQVVDLALAQARRWADAGTPIPVAVNASVESLGELAVTVRHGLVAHGVPASMLCVELTEDALVADHAVVGDVLTGLRELGVRVSIDDYGTGYSTLGYLRELPLDELKIDRSFVRGMADDPRSRTIVQSTVALAHGLGLRLVAQGVETERDADAALAAGCDVAQGWYFGRPVPARDLAGALSQGYSAQASAKGAIDRIKSDAADADVIDETRA